MDARRCDALQKFKGRQPHVAHSLDEHDASSIVDARVVERLYKRASKRGKSMITFFHHNATPSYNRVWRHIGSGKLLFT